MYFIYVWHLKSSGNSDGIHFKTWYISSFLQMCSLVSNVIPLRIFFIFTTTNWCCVAAVKHLPVLYFSVISILCDCLSRSVESYIRGYQIRPGWPKLVGQIPETWHFSCFKVYKRVHCSQRAFLWESIWSKLSSAGTWRKYNVGSTSMQRHDVASTLRRRCINVMCLLGLPPKYSPCISILFSRRSI